MIFLPIIIKAIIVLVFFIGFIRQVLYWSWLWQLKEYKTNKMRAHFQDIGARRAFLALIGYSPLRQLKIPKFTVKVILIFILSYSAAVVILFLFFKNLSPSVQYIAFTNFAYWQNYLFENKILIGCLLVGYFAMPAIIFIFISALNIISAIFKKITIARAKAKISKFSNLKVIGITGSYGKSITKEILADILSKKYKILRTPANINTAIGIAQLILNKLDKTCEVFVVEMGAYEIGEIKEICDLVQPQIGIITAINEQHLALFGSIENTIKAKFELVDSLPNTGLAILNIGDVNIEAGMELRSSAANHIKARVVKYSVGAKSDVYAIGEATDRQSIKFKFISGVDIKDFIVNITGVHNISNALAAIIAARGLNMDLNEISKILQKTNYFEAALKKIAGPNGSILIDDTYNSNPNGVFAALNHIKNQRGSKMVIMSSLIELGACSHEIHQKIGKEISSAASQVFFLDNYYIADIKKGLLESENSDIEIKKEKNIKTISEYLKNELKSTDTVLFINRGARKVLEELKKDSD